MDCDYSDFIKNENENENEIQYSKNNDDFKISRIKI